MDAKQVDENNIEEQNTKRRRPVELMLLHCCFGHHSIKSLLAADASNVWNDIKVSIDPTGICNTCQITFARAKARGDKAQFDKDTTVPGTVWYMDIIKTPHPEGVNKRMYFPWYIVFSLCM